jgi:hypothetical protein
MKIKVKNKIVIILLVVGTGCIWRDATQSGAIYALQKKMPKFIKM